MSESLKALKSAREKMKIKYFKNLSLTPSKKIQKFSDDFGDKNHLWNG